MQRLCFGIWVVLALLFRFLPTTSFSLLSISGRRAWRSSSLARATTTRRTGIFAAKSFSSNRNDMDEFGDDAFLADFDVDAAVQNAARVSAAEAQQVVASSSPKPALAPPPASKRIKVTPSPHTSSTALYATNTQVSAYSEPSSATKTTFGSKSQFTMGTKTDPSELSGLNESNYQEKVNSLLQDAVSDNNNKTYNDNDMFSPPPEGSDNVLKPALEKTLKTHFGFDTFRPGQLSVIEAVLHQRDSAVFWATGSGKSLCYQIPPLHTGHIGLVVSPLISLMQDQVNKLNGLSSKKLATFLGSSQLDASEEDAALNGAYPLVYVTPEKLLSGGFLERLASLHQSKKRLCLVAIDESHCVSEWGHDFRKEYRWLGDSLRNHAILGDIPVLALTATAVPRVQQDILSSLQMHNPHVVLQSFDRTNLEIVVKKKDRTLNYRAALDPLIDEIRNNPHAVGGQSTIVYVPTRDKVEEITSYLQHKLGDDNNNGVVEAYHAGLSTDARTRAHVNFLIGRTTVIVATIAFGMGIDKPDTRRVIHFGPPKTVEEYYQQIGRAGRDGLKAECIMYVNEGDFDKYKSDFYLGGLGGAAKEAVTKSIDALRNFSLDTVTCRRKALLDFFHETPAFGERCGTCDTCRNHVRYGVDMERDFGALGARVVLKAIGCLDGQSTSIIEKVLSGKVVETYRYRRGQNATAVSEEIKAAKASMPKKRPMNYFLELVSPLVAKGYLSQATKKGQVNGYSRSWGTYELTSKGRLALNDTQAAINLPVPPSLREVERLQEEKRQEVLAQLKEAGVKLDEIPKEELDTGDGEVIRAYKKWHSYIESLRRQGREDRIQHLEDLRSRIENWRSATAAQYRMAPATVLAEHVIFLIAYTVASMQPGVKVEREALAAAGVRSRGVDSLVETLGQWVDEVQPKPEETSPSAVETESPMFLPAEPIVPTAPWEYAVYKPQKKTGMATWESSHRRFLNGESPQAIAMSPENGRPIQVATVISHILDGLSHGRPVPLQRLATEITSPPPTKAEWEKLQQLEIETGMDVTGDPNTSGVDGAKFTMTEFLRPLMGDVFIDTPYNERPDEDKAKFGKWCGVLKWYIALRRVGYEPSFSGPPKVQDM